MRASSVVAIAVSLWACGTDTAQYVPPPGDAWEIRTPEAMGMDAAKIQAAIDYTLAHETTQIPEDPGVYLTERFRGIPHQEIVGPTATSG